MPRPCKITEKYWTWCYFSVPYPCGVSGTWWKPWTWRIKWCRLRVPYPCRKTRQVNGYCYDCRQVRRVCYGFWCDVYCCEGGKEYSWTEPAFFRFGESWSTGGSKASVEPLEEKGDCEYPKGDPQRTPEPGDPRPGPGPTPEGGVGGVTPGR